MRTLVSSLLVLVLAAGCSPGDGQEIGPGADGDTDSDSDSTPDCSDPDGDGWGVGPDCLGPDCDESDPAIHDQEQCDAMCDEDPTATGCPCDPVVSEPEACYAGPPETIGVGTCRGGLRTCDAGAWTECEGQVLPRDEVCDGFDDDCDGEVDEGVLSDCGTCDSDCYRDCIGVDCEDGFDAEDGAGIVLAEDGSLTLGGTSGLGRTLIWVANNRQGTVSKVDTRERVEVGRYRTAPGTPQPARTTVNVQGDVVVANRDNDQILDSMTGSATKILAGDCEDRDGDGVETSEAGDDILDWGEDECVAWHVDGLPGARGTAFEQRVALDGAIVEYVWVGAYTTRVVVELDSETGEATGRRVEGIYPYGLALGPGGVVWAVGQWFNRLFKIETESLDVTEYAIPAGESAYGLTVDAEGRPWIGGTLARFDPEEETWASPPGLGEGLCVAADAAGHVWTSSRWGHVHKIDIETLEHETIETGGNEYGWAVDFDGYPWGINIYGNSATVIDPEDNSFETVSPPFEFPYSYSDMTGFQLVNAVNPVGRWSHVFEGCARRETGWTSLSFDVRAPDGTAVAFRVRTAGTLAALAMADWVPVASVPADVSPVDLAAVLDRAGVAPASLLEVEVTLRSIEREVAPVVRSIGIDFACGDALE